MHRAEELIDGFAEQEAADPEEVLDTLVDFIVNNDLAERVVKVLCGWIDEERFGEELTEFLQRKGVGVEGN